MKKYFLLTIMFLTSLSLYGFDQNAINNLSKSRMAEGVDLSKANLSGWNLNGFDFAGANFAGADLSGANLAGANLCGANLTNAKLKGATGACIPFSMTGAIMPDGTIHK